MATRRKHFAKSFGQYGARVRLYERAGGVLWLEVRQKGQEPTAESLGHRDRARGVEQAKERQAQVALGIARTSKATLGALLDAYTDRQDERTDLRPSAQADTARTVAYWRAMLGEAKAAAAVTLDDVERAGEKRRAGLVNARGVTAPADERRPVRARAVAKDMEVLRAVYRWAVLKRKMLASNPIDGLTILQEANPRRPVADTDRYEATRDVAGQVTMELRGTGRRVEVTSYLPELLDLAYATGRRISAILALCYDDLRLTVQPFGEIRWAAAADKMGREWSAPIDERARAALDGILVDREVGTRARWKDSPWLFPSPRNASRSVSKDLASDWLERAEEKAKLPKLDGSLWHAYRRGWATARKHHPLADVGQAGGWKTLSVLSDIYQRPDAETTRRVVLEPRELRS
jgi:integrase